MDAFDALPPIQQLRRVLPQLPARLQDAARYISEHEFDATTRSMRELAASARLQPALFTRLAQAIGRSGWDEFRNELIEARRPERPYSSRVHSGGAGGNDSCDRLIADIRASDVESLNRVVVDAIVRASKTLHVAPRIWVVGFKSGRSIASLLHYQLRMFRDDVFLLGGTGLDDFDFIDIKKSDAVVIFSFAPYTPATLATMKEARGAGCRIVSITDRLSSPVAEGADHCLLFDASSSPAFFPSLTAATSIVQALAAAVFKLGGRTSAARLRQAEARLSAHRQYVGERGEPI